MVNYVPKNNSYTCLSTDSLTDLTSSLQTEGIKLLVTDTGESKIFDMQTHSFIIDKDSTAYMNDNNIADYGGKVITGTSAVTSDSGYYFYAIQVTTDMMVTVQGNVSGAINPNLVLLTGGISAGTVVFGKWNSITLSSGEAIGYYAKV